MNINEIVREYPKGLINWYCFKKGGRILIISDTESVLQELFNHEYIVDVKSITELGNLKIKYDYIIAVGQLEKQENPVLFLKGLKEILKESGHILLGTENRLGLKYFCGDRDPFTGRSFDGIEHYRRVSLLDRDYIKGRCYSKNDLIELLGKTGFKSKFFSILPDLKSPQLIYAENYMPVEELGMRYFPIYNYPDSVFIEEEHLYTDIIKNGMFHSMANSFLIDISINDDFDNINHVTLSMDRGKENALATIIRSDDIVEKKYLYSEGKLKLTNLISNTLDLKKHSVEMVDAEYKDGRYVMPFLDAPIAMNYLRDLIKIDKDEFINKMDELREIILHSSEYFVDSDGHYILKKGYPDLVPLNAFYVNEKFVFFDQEFCVENYPADTIVFRTINIVYMNDPDIEKILCKEFFYERYDLSDQIQRLNEMSNRFTADIRNQRLLRPYNEKYCRNMNIINTNRQRMNYSQLDFQRKFVDIFRNTDSRKVVIFGSGTFAKRFLVQFKKQCEIAAIIDNNSSKWGKEIEGVMINSPEILLGHEKEYQVIVCVKNYIGIVHQLEKMEINDYCIYDLNIEFYNEKAKERQQDKYDGEKKYKVGYIAGVFDLFHIGHLNMFKHAKEQCEYLIVGVVSDEGVRRHKKTENFIPFEERIELVRSCKYVDEAVEIPLDFGGTRDAYNMYHFDCQFSGTDYKDNPDWLADKEYLQKYGSDLIFFPYTEGTSSSQIKKLISQKLV